MAGERGKLGKFLREVIDMTWEEFCLAERDPKYTGLEATVLSLVRTTSEGKLGAIRLAIDRIDGPIARPVNIEYPKVFLLYPHATEAAPPPPGTKPLPSPSVRAEPEPEVDEENVATMTLRDTLKKMADSPRVVTQVILKRKEEVEEAIARDQKIDDGEDAEKKVPLVKSVISANLLQLGHNNNFEAITEIFDQIDGKLAETIKIMGSDIYITRFDSIAPYNAVKNDDGVYQLESEEVTEIWKRKLSLNLSNS